MESREKGCRFRITRTISEDNGALIDSVISYIMKQNDELLPFANIDEQLKEAIDKIDDLFENDNLFTFSDECEQYLTLFDDVKKLMRKIIYNYHSVNVHESITSPAVKFIYSKYCLSLLTVLPHKCVIIGIDDLKQFLSDCVNKC